MNAERDAASEQPDPEVAAALRAVLLYGMLPLWVVPGLADYAFHRRSHIERTAGTHESVLHLAMAASTGLPVAAGLFLEIDAGVIALMAASVILHSAVAVWDVDYTAPRRHISANEQHAHSVLEVLPISAFACVAALRPRQFAAMFGRGPQAPHWRPRPKQMPLPLGYRIGILGVLTAFVGVPYLEEFVRCWRSDRTLRPHPPREEP